MGKRRSEKEKQEFVARHQNGEPVRQLCAEAGVSKSAFYERIARYQVIRGQEGQEVTPREFEHLKRKAGSHADGEL